MFNAAVFDLAPEPVSARPGLAKVLATQVVTPFFEQFQSTESVFM